MSTTITIPDSKFAGFYYPEILQALLEFKRVNVPEITEESDFETVIQMLRAFALVGHLNNTHLDVAANELLIPTLKLRESLKRLLALIGVRLDGATVAQVDLLIELSRVVDADVTGYIPGLTEFATTAPSIVYESPSADLDLDRTDFLHRVFAIEQEQGGADGVVATASPNRFKAASATYTSADVGKTLVVRDSISGNEGEFVVTAFIAVDQVEVSGSSFVTETGLTWRLMAFTVDFSTEANGVGLFTPWTTPVAQDALYISHQQILWHLFEVTVSTAATGLFGVWEFFDDDLSSENPDTVTDLGGSIRFGLDTLIGGMGDATGALIRVEYTPTGASEVVTSIFAASENRIETNGLLGQASVSIDVNDYLVRVEDGWRPLSGDDGAETGGVSFAQNGFVNYAFPNSLLQKWQSTTVNEVVAIWLRFRITTATAATSPILGRIDPSAGGATFGQFYPVTVTQGDTVGPRILGSSTGLADQTFTMPDTPFIDGSQTVEVDEGGGFVEWVAVVDFLASDSTSRHYTVDTNEVTQGVVTFGNGTKGKIPPSGTDNVRSTWRVGADFDGNVGAGEITENADGLPFVRSVSNPRPGTGFKVAEGSTPEDLALQKVLGPAELRTRNRALNAEDVEFLALTFVTDDGSSPVFRAFAIEEELGVKTISVIVVGAAGALLTDAQREELEEFFNGDRFAVPPVEGVIAMNHSASVFNYVPNVPTINVTVTWKNGVASRIENALINLLNPTALESDGVTFVWDPGDLVARSRIIAEVHSVDPAITNVVLTLPASDINLGPRELPLAVAANITVTIVEP